MTTRLTEPIKRIMASALDIPTLTSTDRQSISEIIAQVDVSPSAPDCEVSLDSYADTLAALLAQVRDIVADRRRQTA